MEFTQINRTEADKVWVVGKNITGASVSSHVPVEIDFVSVTDGHAFTASKSGATAGVFLGITDRACADSEDGVLVQVYGFRQSAYVSQASAAIPAGVMLKPGAGGVLVSAYSAGVALGFNHITLLETTSAKSAGTIDLFAVFIRAM